MTTVPAGKWIEDVVSNDRITRAAKKSLAARLKVIRRCLSRSARKSLLETARIHLMRVSSRRAEEALSIYQEFLPPRRARWIEKQIKRLRKAAGPARDSDVLKALLESHTPPECPAFLIEELSRHRAEGESLIVGESRRLRKKREFSSRARALVQRVRYRGEQARGGGKQSFHDWAGTKLRECVQEFFDAAPTCVCDLDALHEFRIRTKKLRYTMELLGPAFPASFREEIYPRVETLQNKLGEINDCRNVCTYLQSRMEGTFPAEYRQPLQALQDAWRTRLEWSQTEFFAWWTRQQARSLEDAFEEMLADREETAPPFGYTERENVG